MDWILDHIRKWDETFNNSLSVGYGHSQKGVSDSLDGPQEGVLWIKRCVKCSRLKSSFDRNQKMAGVRYNHSLGSQSFVSTFLLKVFSYGQRKCIKNGIEMSGECMYIISPVSGSVKLFFDFGYLFCLFVKKYSST